MAEGINWSKVDFVDNQDTLNLIERVCTLSNINYNNNNKIKETLGSVSNSR